MLQLAVDGVEDLDHYLHHRRIIEPEQRITGAERAGDGNMNLVLRASLDDGSTLIVKQARGWVEKYPDIAAPAERLLAEADFYAAVAGQPAIAEHMPTLLHLDETNCVAVLQDLGEAADYSSLYTGASLPAADLQALLAWLAALHQAPLTPSSWPRLRNRAMRELNHTHIFEVPLQAGGPDVEPFCPGLGAEATRLRQDVNLRERAATLGRHYLQDGPCLLHGDFYPGSWLATTGSPHGAPIAGPAIIDPEFGHFGAAEFDVGVLMAHLLFAGIDADVLAGYAAPPGFDATLARAFAGAELVRRLLGVAQLPLQAGRDERSAWLERGRAWMLDA